MDDRLKSLKGSPSRDLFKLRHKSIDRRMWACDLDFVLVDKEPFPDIVAVLDYKQHNDEITFSEVIAYNAMLKRGVPVYIVQGDADAGRFSIFHYRGGNHIKPRYDLAQVARTENWHHFEQWQKRLRQRRRDRYKEK